MKHLNLILALAFLCMYSHTYAQSAENIYQELDGEGRLIIHYDLVAQELSGFLLSSIRLPYNESHFFTLRFIQELPFLNKVNYVPGSNYNNRRGNG